MAAALDDFLAGLDDRLAAHKAAPHAEAADAGAIIARPAREVCSWVGSDVARSRAVYHRERARPRPRRTVLAHCRKVAC